MELHQLGVAQTGPGLHRQAEGIARVLVAPRGGTPPDTRMAARGKNDRVRVDQVALPVREVEPVGAEDGAVVYQEPGDVDAAVEHRNVELARPSDQRALDLQTGVVTGEGGPPRTVRAEEALEIWCPSPPAEGHAVAVQVVDAPGAPGVTISTVRGSASR